MSTTNIKNKDLKRRIIEISYKLGLSHIGSCLTAVDIIDEIYKGKRPGEKFVLSSGHAGLALYTVLDKYSDPNTGKSAEEIFKHHGVHPDRCSECGIDCSSGSLGNGLPIALGMALADRTKNVYCLISDGECAEGSIWEALRIVQEQKVDNLLIYVNMNGWGAYEPIEKMQLITKLGLFTQISKPFIYIEDTNVNYLPFLNKPTSQQAHYHVMTDEEYKQAMEILT